MASNDLQLLQGYKIQGIYYLNKRTHRIQQNVGGACPLLALCNTLFLNHQIQYNKGGRRIKFQELTDCLTQHLENMLNESNVDGKLVKTELRVDKHNPLDNNNLSDIDISIDIDDDDDDDNIHDVVITNNNIKNNKKKDENNKISIECKDKENISHNNTITNNNNNNNNNDTEEKEKEQEKAKQTEQDKEKEMDLKIRQIEECVSLFPKLEEGLDINIKFGDACDFEENPGYRMFSHYGFKIFHGWVVDPKKNENKLHNLIGNKSYDETIDYLISDPPKEATETEKKLLEDNKDLIRLFFSESATQLTSYGLERLYKLMDEYGEDLLAIFFRNNHFSTIVKHQGILYEFVTDEGIVDADPQITWQTLSQISGDEEFVNNKFQSIHTNISQYTQLAQYNRMKLAAEDDNNDNKQVESIDDDDNDKLISILNTALQYIEGESFPKLNKVSDEDANIDPLISHGLTQRITDTFDPFMCKDYIYGITSRYNDEIKQDINHIMSFKIRSFRMSDARSVLNLMSIAHKAENKHFRNIDFMHNDNKYALLMQIDSGEGNGEDIIIQQQEMERTIGNHNKIKMSSHVMMGCIIYEWMKFNFWDWRESDWEDYDMESVYNVNVNVNYRYSRQKLLRESGVRCDYFVNVSDLCILSDYNNKGFGSQLLQSLIYSFPSGTKFGVLVPTINTQAVKCFTKCGFTITRLEQSQSHNPQSNDTKYKMTKTSKFSFNTYQAFRNNPYVIHKKVINVSQMTNSNVSNSNIYGLDSQPDDDDEDDDDEEEVDDDDEEVECGGGGDDSQQEDHDIDHDIDIDIEDRHDDIDDVDVDDVDVDEDIDDDIDDIDRIHCDEPVQHHGHHQGQISGVGVGVGVGVPSSDINNIGVGGLFGFHGGNINNVGVGDTFIFQMLCQLHLTRYHNIFMEFNINKDALLHLDPSVVEFMINDENDRNNFLQWLNQYKLSNTNIKTDTSKPSKPPQQQCMNVKTHDDDAMGIDIDDENK